MKKITIDDKARIMTALMMQRAREMASYTGLSVKFCMGIVAREYARKAA